jgi:hypothetical protein
MISLDELKTIMDRQCYLLAEQEINLTSQSGRDILVNSILTEINFLIDSKRILGDKCDN